MNKEEKKHIHRLIDTIEKRFRKQMCLVADDEQCTEEIIRAHTIQNSRSLKLIQKNGHVKGFGRNPDRLGNEALVLRSFSINEASTFYGFCKFHDETLFREIDNEQFLPTSKQTYLITYRSIARELYAKIVAIDAVSDRLALINKIPDRVMREDRIFKFNSYAIGFKKGKNILLNYTNEMITGIKKSDFSDIDYLQINLRKFPEIMVSGVIMPEFDYNFNKIQDLTGNELIKYLCVNIFADHNKGMVLLTWKKTPIIEQFLYSIFEKDDFFNRLIELCFVYIENIFFSVDWWDNLIESKKKYVTDLVYNIDHYDQHGNYNGIQYSNNRLVDWNIESFATNNDLCDEIINLTASSSG